MQKKQLATKIMAQITICFFFIKFSPKKQRSSLLLTMFRPSDLHQAALHTQPNHSSDKEVLPVLTSCLHRKWDNVLHCVVGHLLRVVTWVEQHFLQSLMSSTRTHCKKRLSIKSA